jgi:hypothetical protein
MRVAVQRERELFHDIATAWVAAFPKSADAVEALALSLDLLGDPAAIGTLVRARALATTPEERLRVAGAEVWMRVKFSVPSDLAGLRWARALADSLLREHRPPNAPEPLLLASLAALTGRANLAAELTRQPAAVAEWDVPAPLRTAAGPLLTFAALGGPVDSLRELEDQVDAAIDRSLIAPLQPGARMAWLARAATIAFPDYRFSSLPKLAGAGDYDVDAEAAFLRGDTAAVRRMLADVQAVRRRFSPADLSPDALFPEAWLLAALGDDRAAISWIEPTLRALPLSETRTFLDPANAGTLIRMMALRAELAERVGDPATAARWARTVSTLWSDADPFLQTRVRQIERLVKVAP